MPENETAVPVAPILAGDEMAVTVQARPAPPRTGTRITDQELMDLLHTCPTAWSGDAGFRNWTTAIFNAGVDHVPQTNPPTLNTLTPNITQKNKDALIAINGTNFDPTTVKVSVVDNLLAPEATPAPTATDLTVLIPQNYIPNPGFIFISVVNGDGAVSNDLTLVIT